MGRPLFSKWNIAGVVQYLQENQLVGYGNVIAKPTKVNFRKLFGRLREQQHWWKDQRFEEKNFVFEGYDRVHLQLYGLVVDSFILEYIPNLFKRLFWVRRSRNGHTGKKRPKTSLKRES